MKSIYVNENAIKSRLTAANSSQTACFSKKGLPPEDDYRFCTILRKMPLSQAELAAHQGKVNGIEDAVLVEITGLPPDNLDRFVIQILPQQRHIRNV